MGRVADLPGRGPYAAVPLERFFQRSAIIREQQRRIRQLEREVACLDENLTALSTSHDTVKRERDAALGQLERVSHDRDLWRVSCEVWADEARARAADLAAVVGGVCS